MKFKYEQGKEKLRLSIEENDDDWKKVIDFSMIKFKN